METTDMGNNEQLNRGVAKQSDGTWLAMTFCASKYFKTEAGARKWFARMTNV